MPLSPDPWAAQAPAPTMAPAPVSGQKLVSREAEGTLARTMTMGPALMGVGLIDTLGQSVGVFDDTTVQRALSAVMPGGGGDYYANNKELFRAGGEILGIALPGMIATKLMRSARYAREVGKLGQYLKNSTALDHLLGTSTALTTAEQSVYNAASKVPQGLFAGKSFAVPAVENAKLGYFASRAAETVRQTAVMEASYRLLFNDSELFAPADYTLSDEVKWAGAATAVGVGLDFAVGRYAVRKLIQAAAASRPPLTSGADLVADVIFRPNDRGTGITYFASQKTQLDAVAKNSTDQPLKTAIGQDQITIDGILKTQLTEMAADPHEYIPKAALSDGQFKLSLTALGQNETTFLFATKLGQVPESGVEFYAGMESAVRRAKDEVTEATGIQLLTGKTDKLVKANEKLTVLENAQNEVHYVIENTGDFTPYRVRSDNWLDRHSFDDIRQKTTQEPLDPTLPVRDRKFRAHVEYSTGPGSKWSLDNKFVLSLAQDAKQEDRSAAFAAASKVIAKWKPIENQHNFVMNEQLPWFQLEATATLNRTQSASQPFMQFDGKFRSWDDVDFAILDKKYQEFNKLMGQTERVSKSSIPAIRSQAIDPADIIARLNLPASIGMRPHPLIELFAQGRIQGHKTLEDMLLSTNKFRTEPFTKMDAVQTAMRSGVDGQVGQQFDTAGKMFLQKDVRPIFVAGSSIPALSRNEAMLHGMIETRRDLALSRLAEIDPQQAPIVAAVLANTLDTGSLAAAKNVRSLYDGVATGRGNVVFQDRINDQFSTLKALALVTQRNEKKIEQLVTQLVSQRLTTLMGNLRAKDNKGVLFDFNRIEQAYRHGWDIKEVQLEGAQAKFVLNKSEQNERLLKAHFDTTFEDIVDENGAAFLPDMSVTQLKKGYNPLTVHAAAADTAKEISNLSKQSGTEVNALRTALGKGPIKIRDFHLPTPELFREGTHFVRNDTGKIIATYTGGTAAQNKARAEAAATKLQEVTKTAHQVSAIEDVRRNHNIYDDTFFDVIDYSDQLAKNGVGIKGGLVRTEIDTGPQTLTNMVESLNEQFLQAGIRAQAAVFEPQLNFAEQAAQVAGLKSKIGPNIFSRYQALVFNRAPVSPDQAIPTLYNWADSGLDQGLSWLNAKYSELIAGSEAGKAGARTMREVLRRSTSDKEFKEMQRSMDKWSPFETTQDWFESTYREQPRSDIRNMSARLSVISSAMSLRILDAGTALLNLSGLVTTAPAVLASMRKLPTENVEEWISRTAAWGSSYTNTPSVITFSPMKAMGSAIHAYWKGELNEPMERAAKMGFFTPEYASLSRILTDPKFGGKNHFDKWVDKASYLADNTEILTRKLSWGMGYKIGKELHGFTDDRNAFIYANNFMNDMIGNYNPKNKPAMFRGAVGLPLGAFQTYMFNFYRRMYGYLERKDTASIKAAYATQASVFGAQSVPGWGVFNNAVLSNYDGSDSLQTRLDRKFPPGVGELLLHGSLSSIPAVFGAGGIALYPRGSVDITQPPPTVADYGRAPPILFLQKVVEGFGSTVDNVFGAGGWSLQQQEEILANMSTNRALKSVMEFAANAKTDRVGGAIDIGTRNAIHVASALLGTVPSHAKRMQDSYYAQKQVELRQADLRASLTDKTRALIRGDEFSVDRLQGLVMEYTRSGGNPAYFGEWLRNTTETALTPKAVRVLKDTASSHRWIEFLNMLSALQQNGQVK